MVPFTVLLILATTAIGNSLSKNNAVELEIGDKHPVELVEGTYGKSDERTWLLTCPESRHVSMQFKIFNLKLDDAALSVFDGDSNQAALLTGTALTGGPACHWNNNEGCHPGTALQLQSTGTQMQSTGSTMFLHFQANSEAVFAEFNADVRCKVCSNKEPLNKSCEFQKGRGRLKKKCRSDQWVHKKFCAQTCFDAGFGYKGMDCKDDTIASYAWLEQKFVESSDVVSKLEVLSGIPQHYGSCIQGDGALFCNREGCHPTVPCQHGMVVGKAAGSCSCTCFTGYKGDACETAKLCTLDGRGDTEGIACLNSGVAKSTTGSCSCDCARGYEGTHCETLKSCTDNGDGDTVAHPYCLNNGPVAGATSDCSCKCGNMYEGLHCETPTTCQSEFTTENGVSGGIGTFTGEAFVFSCNEGYKASEPATCISGLSNSWDDTPTCIDINECATGHEAVCGTGGTCTQTTDGAADAVDTYYCACAAGYTGAGKKGKCVDFDECATGHEAVCGTGGTCTQTTDGEADAVDTYYCACDAGYTGAGEKGKCVACFDFTNVASISGGSSSSCTACTGSSQTECTSQTHTCGAGYHTYATASGTCSACFDFTNVASISGGSSSSCTACTGSSQTECTSQTHTCGAGYHTYATASGTCSAYYTGTPGTTSCDATADGGGVACDDGNAATHTDVCLEGETTCVGTAYYNGTPGTDSCDSTPGGGGVACDDGNPATHTDVCRNRSTTCRGIFCYTGAPGTDSCDATAACEGVTCDDDNAATQNDKCIKDSNLCGAE